MTRVILSNLCRFRKLFFLMATPLLEKIQSIFSQPSLSLPPLSHLRFSRATAGITAMRVIVIVITEMERDSRKSETHEQCRVEYIHILRTLSVMEIRIKEYNYYMNYITPEGCTKNCGVARGTPEKKGVDVPARRQCTGRPRRHPRFQILCPVPR